MLLKKSENKLKRHGVAIIEDLFNEMSVQINSFKKRAIDHLSSQISNAFKTKLN